MVGIMKAILIWNKAFFARIFREERLFNISKGFELWWVRFLKRKWSTKTLLVRKWKFVETLFRLRRSSISASNWSIALLIRQLLVRNSLYESFLTRQAKKKVHERLIQREIVFKTSCAKMHKRKPVSSCEIRVNLSGLTCEHRLKKRMSIE